MKEIYFHIGLGKTGTKYLQLDFFPKLKGITYIPMTKYKNSKKIIKKKEEGKFLVSRECDERFEEMVREFAEIFPDTGVIMVLRRQDEWIYSQFKRLIKNGRRWKFKDFFNFENTGYFKVEDLYFYKKIEIVKDNFRKKPLILLYDELRKEPYKFLDKIAKYTGTTYDKERIPLRKKHKSYGEKELSVLYTISRHIDLIPRGFFKKYFFVYPLRYPLLYISRYLPDSFIPKVDIFPSKEELNKVKKFYEQDWEKCVEYAKLSEKELIL